MIKKYWEGNIITSVLFNLNTPGFEAYSSEDVASTTTLFKRFVKGKSKRPATRAAITLIPKKTALLSNLSQKPASIPEIFPPNEVVINHPPIIKAVNLRGATLDVSDKPTGLTNN